MVRFDASNSSCRIYVRRTGVLGAVGHDLAIGVATYRIELDGLLASGPRIDAEFAASSLRVIGAIEGRSLAPRENALSTRDRSTIERHIAHDVLDSARHPAVVFRSTAVEQRDSGYAVRGRLQLHGTERELAFNVERDGERWVAEANVHQPAFGIRPFRAFAGALRVEPDVRVRIELRWFPGSGSNPPAADANAR